jgi:hypothetical protein
MGLLRRWLVRRWARQQIRRIFRARLFGTAEVREELARLRRIEREGRRDA